MTHNTEIASAAYLAGELSEDERKSFEQHLLECDDCWTDVDEARRGQAAVETLRELAPLHLRAAVRRSSPLQPSAQRHRIMLAVAAAVALVAGIGAGIVLARRPADPAVIAAAFDGYMNDELPGSAMPKTEAPDLSELRMTDMGAGAGRIDGVPVTAYAYRDATGRRLIVYVGIAAFPMPRNAHMLHGKTGPWMTHRDGIALLCARHPHKVLIVGEDDALVTSAAEALDVM